MVLHLASICPNDKRMVKNKSETFNCGISRLRSLSGLDSWKNASVAYHRIHGGFRKCRARKRARRRRIDRGLGLGRGAIGGARNIDPKSAPSSAPSAPVRDVEKNAEVISVWLALPAPPLRFLAGRATAMKRDTSDGNAPRAWRKKRDTDFAA